MKNRYIPLTLIFLTVTFFACKKENKNPVIGKWQQNKVRIYTIGTNGTIVNDTTYSGNTFTNLDYIQFNNNGTCISSSSHLYYPANEGSPKEPQIASSKITQNYTTVGSRYVLTSIPPPPFEVSENDTATLINSHNLLVHFSGHGPVAGPIIVSDSYYSR